MGEVMGEIISRLYKYNKNKKNFKKNKNFQNDNFLFKILYI